MVELAAVLVFGILAQWLASRLRLPAILPLILTGLAVGPVSTFFTESGEKFIDTSVLFQGELFHDFVSLAVGIILFEGGLQLKLREVREVASTVRNLIFLGSLITMAGGAWAAHYFMGLDWRIAILFGALVIVTGPTVIGPIVKNVRPNSKIAAVLKWEGVLIDPVGAFVAILVYEFIASGLGTNEASLMALKSFVLTVLSGLATGTGMSLIVYFLLKRGWIPQHLRNVVMLAFVIFTFAISDLMHAESGLLGVTLLGIILSNTNLDSIRDILAFKEDLVVILISLLFILLSAGMQITDIERLGEPSLWVFAVVVWVLRPIAIWVSSIGSNLNWREKVFLSWICPRGIVAVGVASIFTLQLMSEKHIDHLTEAEVAQVPILLPLVFLIILGTVIIQGITAKPLAKLLKVEREKPRGMLFVGAGEVSRVLAKYLESRGFPVLLADTSSANIAEAKMMGLNTYQGSLLVENATDNVDLSPYAKMMALTSSAEINLLACRILAGEIGQKSVFRYITRKELEYTELVRPKTVLFDGRADFVGLTQILRKRPHFEELEIRDEAHLESFLAEHPKEVVPLVLLSPRNKDVWPVSGFRHNIRPGEVLVYVRNDVS